MIIHIYFQNGKKTGRGGCLWPSRIDLPSSGKDINRNPIIKGYLRCKKSKRPDSIFVYRRRRRYIGEIFNDRRPLFSPLDQQHGSPHLRESYL